MTIAYVSSQLKAYLWAWVGGGETGACTFWVGMRLMAGTKYTKKNKSRMTGMAIMGDVGTVVLFECSGGDGGGSGGDVGNDGSCGNSGGGGSDDWGSTTAARRLR